MNLQHIDIMKRTFLLLLLTFTFSSVSVFAQEVNSLSQCNNLQDTLTVLKNKFVDRKNIFVEQRAAVFFEEFKKELPIQYAGIDGTSPYTDSEGEVYVEGIYINYLNWHEAIARFDAKKPAIYIYVRFKKNETTLEQFTASITSDDPYGLEELEKAGNFLIEDIKIFVAGG